MKRLTAVFCAILMSALIACAVTLTAFAESTAFEIDELNMSVPIPNEMLVVTRDSSENDPFFSTFGLDYNTTMSQLNEGNIYLEAMSPDSALTLTVTMTITEDSQTIGSYNSLADEELANIMEKLRSNETYKDASPVQYRDVKYICLNMGYNSGKNAVEALQYNTVFNGENINITLQTAPGGKLTKENREMLADVVQETTILADNFFNRNRGIILYGSITLLAVAVVIVVFVLIFKYVRNPDRKHKLLVHELAHEHKISETTQIPRKHILEVTKPTNTFLTKYEPVDEIGKKKKKKKQVAADEINEIRSYSEPAPEQEQVTTVEYDERAEELVVPVEPDELPAHAEPVSQEAEKPDEADTTVSEAFAEEQTDTVEQTALTEPAEPAEPAEPDEPEELPEETQAVIADIIGDVPVEEENLGDVSGEEGFEKPADYFDELPREKEMYSYTDVDTAVEDYRAAAGKDEEEDEDIPRNWDTVKKVLIAIGKGIVTVFKTIFIAIWYFITHVRYFCINVYRLIKRKRAQKKRRKAEQERRRQASERRRMQREAERERRRANANRGANDLVKVHSSGERRPAPRENYRQRTAYPSSRRSDSYGRSRQRDRSDRRR